MGLIGYKTDGAWSYRPTYYAWGLLCNYIPKGSEVYPVTGEDGGLIDAVCVKAPDGTWSLIAVNRSGAEQTVKIATGMFDCEMDTYLFCEDRLPTDGSQIAADGKISAENGVYSITLPAYSFRVLNGKQEATEQTTETEPEAMTEGQTDAQTEGQTEGTPGEKGGCKSAAMPAVALLGAAAAAVALVRKKDEA